jgi:RNA polymerase sigma-70 factor, ECF subfamily
MPVMAGATVLGDLASVVGAREQESTILAELKAGSEDAYSWLIAHYHQPVYSLVYRMLNDSADAADTTQEVFLKVFRGIKKFNGGSSLKTWIYRIALHEASNRRRWWSRHKARETSIEPVETEAGTMQRDMSDVLVDGRKSPFDSVADHEIQARVDCELGQIQEPYRTTVILRDIEELSYEEIAEITEVSLGTVKSRVTRGRDALRKRLEPYLRDIGGDLGVRPKGAHTTGDRLPQSRQEPPMMQGGREVEVTS